MLSRKDIQYLKEQAAYESNNCGGCETCSQIFGDTEYTVAPEDVYELAVMVEKLTETITLMTNLAACRSKDLSEDLDGVWEVGKECLCGMKKD